MWSGFLAYVFVCASAVDVIYFETSLVSCLACWKIHPEIGCFKNLSPAVERVDSVIQPINCYPVDKMH